MKHSYEAPALTVEGSVESLTAQISRDLNRLDKDYPQNTPKRNVLYS